MSNDFERRLQEAAKRGLSPSEVWDQRVSLAMGMLPQDSTMMRSEGERIATLMHGPRPDDLSVREAAQAVVDQWEGDYPLSNAIRRLRGALAAARAGEE